MVLNFGILGAAGIANKFCSAVAGATDAAKVVAVGSRTLSKAQAFAEKNSIETAYGSYEEVINDPNVNAIYIPLVTTIKKEWALKCVDAGKHVIVEKPFATAQDVQDIQAACAAKKLAFMDGTMFVHHARFSDPSEYRGAITQGGKLRRMTSSFSFPLTGDNIRVHKDTEPLGALGDLGWYNVRVSLWAREYELPTHVVATSFNLNDEGVNLDVVATLIWADGFTSTFDASFECALRQWVEVVGWDSAAYIDDFVITWTAAGLGLFPNREFSDVQEYTINKPDGQRETKKAPACRQEVQMVRDFVAAASAGGNPTFAKESHACQVVLDALMKSIAQDGVKVAL